MKYYFLGYEIDTLDDEDFWSNIGAYPVFYDYGYRVFDSIQAVKDFIISTRSKFQDDKYSFEYKIKARNLHWWTPATKIIHVDTQEKVTDEWTNAEESPTGEPQLLERIIDSTQTYDFDNGLKYSVSIRTYASCQYEIVSLSYVHNGVKKFLDKSSDFDMNLPFVHNFYELIKEYKKQQDTQMKQTLMTRETFLDREMPYLLVA
ncbi:hypothetical protein [Sulfurospirillum multivorans]|uniref:Uncharacterized protein n=2 Tax=Sulfurospirillum multivorans TaxID=66821 RepID=A0AA86AP91_SULMK|nr:hypothetical protein [Sulfurospirillum multivorans]AHJ13078.1 hypothetical protein SMUL_1823 [Sulfurospirillum multivorans DSM 12446]QEH06566.1 hypothetical protein SMN_1801 [Sulfurospirillum multivorans]